jgi:hypothetical protein
MRRDPRTRRASKDCKKQEAQTGNCAGHTFVRAHLMRAVPGRAIEKQRSYDHREDEDAHPRQRHMREG